MKLLTLPALAVLSLSLMACDRRDAEPVEPATTADTAMTDSPAATMPTDTTMAPTDTTTMPPATTAGACEGLTGQALDDCLNQAGPTTNPAMTDPNAPTTNDGTMNQGTTPADADTTTPPRS